jgi:hypothetical protein
MRRLAPPLLLLAIVLAGALHWWRPYLELKRQVATASPGLGPLFTRADVTLPPHRRLCIAPVVLDPRSAIAQITVTAPKRPQPLRISAAAPGYRASVVTASYPGGTLAPVQVALAPPRSTVTGRVCVTNRGRRPVALLGTTEPRSLTVAQPSLDGRVLPGQSVALELLEREPKSILGELGEAFARASALAGGYGPAWLLWPLAIVLVIGAPLALIVGFAAALREERR